MKRFLLVISLALVAACGSDAPPLVASDVVVKPPMPGMQMAAGYLTLRNNSTEEIVIDRVTSPQFGKVEMHETVIEDGIAKMSALAEIVVPAGSAVEFQPGGKHLMLMQAGEIGERVTLRLLNDGVPVLSIEYTFPGGTS